MSAPIRLALVGCGQQMQQNLVPFLHRLKAHRIVACVDGAPARAAQVQAATGAPRAVASVADLDLREVDAAVIAVPPLESEQLTRFFVEHGVDCFVEKPAGSSTAGLRELAEAVDRHGRQVQVGFNFRYAQVLAHLHELSAPGRSWPTAVTIDFHSRHPSAPQWGVDTTIEAWIRHNGVHALDLARWFNPASVVEIDARMVPVGADRLVATVVLQHDQGSVTMLRLGNITKKFMIGVTVQTADASRYSAPSLEQVVLDVDQGTPSGAVLHRTPNLDHGWARSGFGPELDAFLRLIALTPSSTESVVPSIRDALAASILCDQVLEQFATQFDVVGQRTLEGATR